MGFRIPLVRAAEVRTQCRYAPETSIPSRIRTGVLDRGSHREVVRALRQRSRHRHRPDRTRERRARLTGHDSEFRLWALGDDWSDETFDLVVISEVGYYLTFEKLIEAMLQVVEHLEPGGTLLCAHWRHVVPEYPQNGDAVHSAVRQTPGLAQFASYQDEDVLIDVFVKGPPSPPSVARSEGLI